LGEIGDARAVEPLIAALNDHFYVRWKAVVALGEIGDARAVEPLIAALNDAWCVQWRAVVALGEIGDARAVEPLIAYLKEPIIFRGGPLPRYAVIALGKIGSPAVEPLIAALKDKDWSSRERAVVALGEIGDARAVEPLIAAHQMKAGSFDASIIHLALGEIGDARAVEPLIANMKISSSYPYPGRDWAYSFLKKISYARVAEPLIDALNSKDDFVPVDEAIALGKIGSPAVEPLIAALNDESWFIQSSAILALGEIGDARAVEPLIAALNDQDRRIRYRAAKALGEIGDARAVEPLIAALNDQDRSVREGLTEALGEIGDARAAEPLIAALKDKDLKIIKGAYKFFIRRGKPGSEPILINALNSNYSITNYGFTEIGQKGRGFWKICVRRGTLGVELEPIFWNVPKSTYYGLTMAIDFFNCGNSKLKKAACRWAWIHDCSNLLRSGGRDGPRWGEY
jgi:HEAT repeat protein